MSSTMSGVASSVCARTRTGANASAQTSVSTRITVPLTNDLQRHNVRRARERIEQRLCHSLNHCAWPNCLFSSAAWSYRRDEGVHFCGQVSVAEYGRHLDRHQEVRHLDAEFGDGARRGIGRKELGPLFVET